MKLFSALAVCAVLGAPATAQKVWVVDDVTSRGVQFEKVQDAVDAASNGDTIFIRRGKHDPFTIDGKSLVVTGPRIGTQVTSALQAPLVTIRNLQPQQSVVLRGVSALALSDQAHALFLHDNQGSIWIEDSAFSTDALQTIPPNVREAVVIERCDAVSFVRCAVTVASSTAEFIALGAKNHALRATDSNVYVYDSLFEGGTTLGSNPGKPAAAGGDAVRVTNGFLSAVNSRFEGGSGGVALCDPMGNCGAPSAGGNAVSLLGTAKGHERACVFQEGPGSPSGAPVSGPGLVPLAGSPRTFELESPTLPGETMALDYEGEFGDLVFLFLSTGHSPLPTPGFGGSLLTKLPVSSLFLTAVLTASGDLSLSLQPGSSGFESLTIYVQPVVATLAGETFLASPSALTFMEPTGPIQPPHTTVPGNTQPY